MKSMPVTSFKGARPESPRAHSSGVRANSTAILAAPMVTCGTVRASAGSSARAPAARCISSGTGARSSCSCARGSCAALRSRFSCGRAVPPTARASRTSGAAAPRQSAMPAASATPVTAKNTTTAGRSRARSAVWLERRGAASGIAGKLFGKYAPRIHTKLLQRLLGERHHTRRPHHIPPRRRAGFPLCRGKCFVIHTPKARLE